MAIKPAIGWRPGSNRRHAHSNSSTLMRRVQPRRGSGEQAPAVEDYLDRARPGRFPRAPSS